LSIFTTILASRIGSWQHYLKITSIALQVSMTLVKTDLGFLHIIQRFKIVGRETNNNKGDKFIESVIIIENKLSDATKLTGNQSAARSIAEYTVRSRQISGLEQGLNATLNKWLRVYGDGSGKNIVDITDEFR
jgi:hypothetical protein